MRKFASILLTLCMSLPVCAQFESFRLSSDNQELIREAVKDGLVLVRQSYQLEDTLTGKRYTLDNRPEFGGLTAVAVRTAGGLILPKALLEPWTGDRNYDEFRTENLIPVLSRTSVLSAGDTAWREMPLIAPYRVSPLADTAWVEAADSSYCGNGFTVGKPDSRDGWIVWLASDTEDLDAPDFSMVVYRYELPESAGADGMVDVKSVNTKSTVLGGIVVVPVFDSIGRIDFVLRGVISGSPDAWKLILLGGVESDDSTLIENEPVKLTPVE